MNAELSRHLFESSAKAISGRVATLRNWKILSTEFPVLEIAFVAEGRRELRIRLKCDGWDTCPPSVELCDSEGNRLKRCDGYVKTGKQFNAGPYKDTGLPFVCMAGIREYHTLHHNHRWEDIKSDSRYRLEEIVQQLWSAWKAEQP